MEPMQQGEVDRASRPGAERLERVARGLLGLALMLAVAWAWAGK